MKKRLVAATVCVAFLAGGTALAAKGQTIQIWDWYKDRIDVLKPKPAEYEKLHPGVSVKISQVDWDTYPSKVLAAVIGGAPPDIIEFHNSWTGNLLKILAPYPPELFPSSEMVDQYYQFNTAFRMKDGKFYFFPDGIMTSSIFYNKKLFAQAGVSPTLKTWDDLRVAAKRAAKFASDGKMTSAGFQFPLGTMFDDMNYQLGGSIYNEKHTGVDWFTAEGQKAINVLGDMALSDRIKPTTKDGNLLFETDKVAMHYSWTWYRPILQRVSKGKVEWATMPLPTFTGADTAIRGRNNYECGYAVPANLKQKQKLEAFKFLKWLYSDDEYYVKLNDAMGRLPGKKSLWTRPELVNDVLHSSLMKQIPYTIFPGERPSWMDLLLSTMETDITSGRRSPVDALKVAQSSADKQWKIMPPKWMVEKKIVK